MLDLVLSTAISILGGDSPFADLEYEAALARAKQEQKLLLIDFRADWCAPCKKMEKNTWTDEGVCGWLKENALAIQIDIDEKPELAEQFQIKRIPAVIAIKGGAEFDRSIGYKDAANFLAWLRDVLAGKHPIDPFPEHAKAPVNSQDVEARYELARDFLNAGKYEKALAEYLWLWPATREAPGMGGLRLSFMLSDMAGLAEMYPPAKEAFLGILEDLQRRVDQTELASFEDWQEWSSFCENFGQAGRIITWYEKRRDERGRLFPNREREFLVDRIVSDVFDALVQAGRALDATRLYPDARLRVDRIVTEYEQAQETNESLDVEFEAVLMRSFEQMLVQDLSHFYAVLLVAERRDEAAYAAQKLLETLDKPESRIALVRTALDLVERPEEDFARWLDEAEEVGGRVRVLRKRLEKLQKGAGGSDDR